MSQARPPQPDASDEPPGLRQQRELFGDARAAEACLAALAHAVIQAREAAQTLGLDRVLSPERLRDAVGRDLRAGVGDPEDQLKRGALEAGALASAIDATAAIVIVRRCLKELEPLLPSEPSWEPDASVLAADGVDRVDLRSRRLLGEAERAASTGIEYTRSADLAVVAGARHAADEAMRLAHAASTAAVDERRRRKAMLEEQSRRFSASSFSGQGFLVALAVAVVVYIMVTISGEWILMGLPFLVWVVAAKMIKRHRIRAAKTAIAAEEGLIQRLLQFQARNGRSKSDAERGP